MTNHTSDNAGDAMDLPDTDLKEIFAAVHPGADFEERLVRAVRHRNRFAIPLPIQRASIAAAAVLMVGTFGYFGNRTITGGLHGGQRSRTATPASQPMNYQIEKGDVLNITLNDSMGASPEVTKQVRVDNFGFISLPTVGKIRAAGLSEDELVEEIQHSFKTTQIGDVIATIYTTESRDRSAASVDLNGNPIEKEKDNDMQRFRNQNLLSKLLGGLDTESSSSRGGGTSSSRASDNLDSVMRPSVGENGTQPRSRFIPRSIAQTSVADNTTFRDANGNVVANRAGGSRSLDWISNVGNSAVPGSIAANPADGARESLSKDRTTDSLGVAAFQTDGGKGGQSPLSPPYSTPIVDLNKNGIEGRTEGPSWAGSTSPGAGIQGGSLSGGLGSVTAATPATLFGGGSFNQTGGRTGPNDVGLAKDADGVFPPIARNYVLGSGAGGSLKLQGYRSDVPAEGSDRLNHVDQNGFGGGIRIIQRNFDYSPSNNASGGAITGNVNGLNYFHGNNNGAVSEQDLRKLPARAEQIEFGVDRDSSGESITLKNANEKQSPLSSANKFPLVDLDKTFKETQPEITLKGNDQTLAADRTLIDAALHRPHELANVALAAPGNGQQPAPAAQPQPQPVAPAPAVDDRKIIRTGTMEFDVDRFDTAQVQITKIVGELGGFVGATDSQKLPNGKVRGSISVRVPPGRLDTLVLSLRALGDLKSQQITAADITKEYTDIESELTADRAMQDRLLELIHDGKGTVKDLLAAENELGEWRTKIEKAEGMIRYYNGQVALSTLSITMTERDIQTPATAVETETADVGIEADDVEKARASAMKAIDDVKGRIVEADLKRFDAGQLAAKLVADVPPESAGAVIDQLKLLGKVARLEVHRQQQNTDGNGGSGTPVTNAVPLKTDRKPTRLLISIYNLANVAPRRTTVVSLAAKDVETAYAQLITAAKTNGGRVVTSALDRGDPVKATGSLVLELPPEKIDTAMTTLHAQGDVLNLSLTENPDTQNSTEAKQGLTVKIVSLANVAPRRTTNASVAASDVDSAYAAIINTVKSSGGRVVNSTLDRGDPAKATASLVLETPPDKLEAVIATLHAQGDVLNLNQLENPDTQNSTEAKTGLTVRLSSLAMVKARETIEQDLAAADVPASYQALLSAAAITHSRVDSAELREQDRQNITAEIVLDVPRAAAGDLDKAINAAGGTISRTASRAADTDNTVDSKVHLRLSISSADHLPAREKTALQMEVADVDRSAASAQAAAIAAGGRVLKSTVFKDQGKNTAAVLLDFPLDKYTELLQQVRSEGAVRGIDASRDPQAPTGPMGHGQIYVEFRTADAIVADQTGPWASIRQGLSTSINGLLWSLRWVVVGLCLIGPWAVVGYVGWKVRGKFRNPKPEIRIKSE